MDNILITGSSGDIARALIGQLKTQGMRIVGIDIKNENASEDVHIACDLGDEQQLRQAMATYRDELKEITGIVHLAGIYPSLGLEQYSSALWHQVMAVNVTSLFLIVQSLLQHNNDALRTIVCTSSAAAKVGSRDPAYAASKAALLGLAKSLSLSLAPKGIRVNSVLPGIIDTSMSQVQTAERREEHRRRTLSDTIGKPEEVADVIAFLLGNRSSYLWGASIDVNGGMAF